MYNAMWVPKAPTPSGKGYGPPKQTGYGKGHGAVTIVGGIGGKGSSKGSGYSGGSSGHGGSSKGHGGGSGYSSGSSGGHGGGSKGHVSQPAASYAAPVTNNEYGPPKHAVSGGPVETYAAPVQVGGGYSAPAPPQESYGAPVVEESYGAPQVEESYGAPQG